MVRVKVCGITNLKDALTCVQADCDALGFIFYKKSKRYISPEKARAIIREIPKRVKKIGVFVNSRQEAIKRIAKLCSLDILQFHGNESPEFCRKFKNYKIVKVFRIKNRIDIKDILKYNTFGYLFDAFSSEKYGGTGKKFNWGLLRYIKDIKKPVFLSGGINEKNVRKAINSVHPDWVDASSSLEIKPGRKNSEKVRRFIKEAKTNK